MTNIEHETGMQISATCQKAFGDSTGWLAGQPNKGSAMFTMMNIERVSVGIQGFELNEIACRSAETCAKDGTQACALSGPKAPEQNADTIIVQARAMFLAIEARKGSAMAMSA